MATFSQKDINLLFVGAAATKTTGSIAAMNDGEIGIFTPAGTRVTEATAATVNEFIIVKKTASGGVPLVSGVINKNNIKRAVRKVYTAAVDQVTVIGYNGTSGSIDVTNDNTYHVRVNLTQGLTSNHGGLYIKHGFYTSDTSATEFEIASNLHTALINEFSKEADKVVKTQMLANHAGAATTGATGTVSVVKGSRFAACSVSATAEFEIGGLVRLGTATTAPVYKIVNASGTTLELNAAVTETTGDYVAGAAEFITAAQAVAASYGLVLTAVQGGYKVGKLENDLRPETHTVSLEGFGTTITTLTASNPGSGTERQVKSLEWFYQGNEGDYFRMGEPNIYPSRAEVSGNYDLIDIVTEEIYTGSMVAGPINKVYTLAIPATAPNYAIAGTADDITDVLEVLAFGSATGALAVS